MKPHIDLAHFFWKRLIKKGDLVVDATLGNGLDFLQLSKLLFPSKKSLLYGMDIQEKALENSKLLMKTEKIDPKQLFFINSSHEDFSFLSRKPRLIVYNLGYLPGSDKTVTTKTKTTLKSVQEGLLCLEEGGALSIMLYPGHKEGNKEKQTLLDFCRKLPLSFSAAQYEFLQNPLAPSFLWIQKRSA